jgi:putative endonuclease
MIRKAEQPPSSMKLSLPFHLRTGLWGEAQAQRFLAAKGYKILGRRVRIGLRDEIDMVARDGATLVFVEVKTKKTESYGRPFAAVDRAKRKAQSRAAVRYLKRLKCPPVCFRFDVVEVVGQEGDPAPLLRHIENAFPLDRRYMVP